MAGVGLLVGQHVAQGLRRGDGGGSQVDGGPEQPEETGGGESLLDQVYPAGAVLHRIGRPAFPQLSPEEEVGEEEPHPHHGAAGIPDGAEEILQGNLPLVLCGGFYRGIEDVLHRKCKGIVRRGGAYRHRWTVRRVVDRRTALSHIGDAVRRKIEGFYILYHRLRRGQHVVLQRGQIDGHQQPQQYQPP